MKPHIIQRGLELDMTARDVDDIKSMMETLECCKTNQRRLFWIYQEMAEFRGSVDTVAFGKIGVAPDYAVDLQTKRIISITDFLDWTAIKGGSPYTYSLIQYRQRQLALYQFWHPVNWKRPKPGLLRSNTING